ALSHINRLDAVASSSTRELSARQATDPGMRPREVLAVQSAGKSRWRQAIGLVLACLAGIATAGEAPPARDGFLLAGAPSAEQTPMRVCTAQMREGLRERRIEAPPGGWPGTPQAINVFNVLSGEVMVAQG